MGSTGCPSGQLDTQPHTHTHWAQPVLSHYLLGLLSRSTVNLLFLAHFEGVMEGTGFTLTCRQHGAASWAQSCLFTEMPRCAKQLVCRQLWPVSTCGLGGLAGTAGALVLAEGVQPGITAHAVTQTCRAAAMVMVQNHSGLACSLMHRHRGPWWTWGQTAQRGRTAQLSRELAQEDLSSPPPSELLGRLREEMQREEETTV